MGGRITQRKTTTAGAAFAIATCALWALSFVSPIVLVAFSPYAVTLGRYAVFGLVSLGLLFVSVREVRALSLKDWIKAAWLALVGHLAYYFFVATGIQLSDVAGPSVVIGLLPVTVPILANLRQLELPWHALALPLLGILGGLFLINADQYRAMSAAGTEARYGLGIASALVALACWTWYGVANAAWLKARPNITAKAWTIAQGVTLLPIVLAAAIAMAVLDIDQSVRYANATEWRKFAVVSLVVGVGSTWLATLCWSLASRLLPTTLAGQFIVCTPIAAIAYGSLYRQAIPSILVGLGVALLTVAVVLAVRALQQQPTST